MRSLVLVTPAATEPITVAEAKLHCRVDNVAEDALLETLIIAAREYVENYCRRALLEQTWRLTLDCWPADGVIQLPRPKLLSVQSVTYVDQTGAVVPLDPSAYVVEADSLPGRIRRVYNTTWPNLRYEPGAVRVLYKAGYGAAPGDIPRAVLAAMKLLIGTWYLNREHVVTGTIATQIPDTVSALLGPYRLLEA